MAVSKTRTAEPSTRKWELDNQRHLIGALAEVKAALKRHASRANGEDVKPELTASGDYLSIAAEMEAPPAIESLCAVFRLSSFERLVLLLCAGIELDSEFGSLCASAQGDTKRAFPTFSLALAALPDSHWSALSPSGTLRRWRMIEVEGSGSLTYNPLRIDERILHYLSGINHLDERLAGMVDAGPATVDLAPSHREKAEQIVATWMRSGSLPVPPAIQLCGNDTSGKRAIASAACHGIGLRLGIIAADTLPLGNTDLDLVIRLWEREALLNKCALLLDCDELDTMDASRSSVISRVTERMTGVIIISARERRKLPQRTMVTIEVQKPTVVEQRAIWRVAVGDGQGHLNGALERIAAQFDVSAQTIYAATAEAMGRIALEDRNASPDSKQALESNVPEAELREKQIVSALWESCRVQARPRLENLAQRIESNTTWDDLVLPEIHKLILKDIVAHVQQRTTVYEKWGFAARGARGLGMSALFAGVSGTGKTMAAEVIANELHLDLFRIDLSSVVSKYIGETEKNLSRVFDAAEEGGAVLLFDEADALFGKRSEVKDSHDRYANIEVSFLLQRMECYRGLAILTTNQRSALDNAFLRRIRFIVQFPFPDAEQRTEIWRRVFPSGVPTDGLDPVRLAQWNVAGGNIRNAALNAAFLAADAGEPVRMKHLLRAAQAEYAKLEKTLTEAEVAGWI